jgi:hypothetical protein
MPAPTRVVVVLGFNDGQREVGLVVKQVIRALGLRPAAYGVYGRRHDAAFGEIDLLADLRLHVPARRTKLGVMNLVQMSRSLRAFLFMERGKPMLRNSRETCSYSTLCNAERQRETRGASEKLVQGLCYYLGGPNSAREG